MLNICISHRVPCVVLLMQLDASRKARANSWSLETLRDKAQDRSRPLRGMKGKQRSKWLSNISSALQGIMDEGKGHIGKW